MFTLFKYISDFLMAMVRTLNDMSELLHEHAYEDAYEEEILSYVPFTILPLQMPCLDEEEDADEDEDEELEDDDDEELEEEEDEELEDDEELEEEDDEGLDEEEDDEEEELDDEELEEEEEEEEEELEEEDEEEEEYSLSLSLSTASSTDYSSILEDLEEEAEIKIRKVSIEGNIGGGKTTLINDLKEKYKDRNDILFLEEPIDIWNNIKDGKGKNILQHFYEDLGKYAFAFQVMAYTTRLQLIKETIANAPKTVKTIVMERSLEADANIFAKMLYEEGVLNTIEYQIYSLMIQDNWEDYGVDGIIWLRTEPEECYSRVQNRNREGEKGIDLAYLRKCHQYHLEWLSADLGFVCSIDTDCKEEDYLEKIEKYLDL